MNKEKWPNLFIVGTGKAGTTSFYQYLNQVPGVFMSPRKEPFFFVNEVIDEDSNNPIRDKKEYLKLYKNVNNEKIIGEASTYLGYPETAKLIYEVVPHAKIIIILRNPIERAFSHYTMSLRDGVTKESFHEALMTQRSRIEKNDRNVPHYLKYSFYSDDVKRFLDVFGREQVKIFLFENFILNEKKTFEQVLQFLDIIYDVENLKIGKYNPASKPRTPLTKLIINNNFISKIANLLLSDSLKLKLRDDLLFKKIVKSMISYDDKKLLYQFYKEDVEKLEKILKSKLPWFNEFKF